jgi:hypothetical protein
LGGESEQGLSEATAENYKSIHNTEVAKRNEDVQIRKTCVVVLFACVQLSCTSAAHLLGGRDPEHEQQTAQAWSL